MADFHVLHAVLNREGLKFTKVSSKGRVIYFLGFDNMITCTVNIWRRSLASQETAWRAYQVRTPLSLCPKGWSSSVVYNSPSPAATARPSALASAPLTLLKP